MREVDEAKKEFPVHRLYNILGGSKRGYFACRHRPDSRRQNEGLVPLAHIRTPLSTFNEAYGAPRMQAECAEEGFAVERHRVARLMRDNGLKALQKRRYEKAADRCRGDTVAAKLLDQDFGCDGSDQKCGADIGDIWTAGGWHYLATVLDLYSRRIIGWASNDRLKTDLAVNALRQPSPGLIQHTDRGSQYLRMTISGF